MLTLLSRRTRRFTQTCATLMAITLATSAPGLAQDLPSGPIQILVAYGAGGGTDTLARLLATPLSNALGQPVVVQNLPGGGGQIAAMTLLRDGTDGSAILATNQPDLFMSTVVKDPPYKASDFQTIMVDLQDPRVMLVQKESDIATLGDLIAKAKAEPGKVTISVAQGSAQELFAKWLFGRLGLDVRLVGYNGGSTAANAMLAGDVLATIGDDFARMNIREKAKALFVVAETKSPRWPEGPILASALPSSITLPADDFLSRYGVYVVSAEFKANNPEGYKKLQQALVEARNSPEFQSYLDKNNLQDLSIGKPGEELETKLADQFTEIPKIGQ